MLENHSSKLAVPVWHIQWVNSTNGAASSQQLSGISSPSAGRGPGPASKGAGRVNLRSILLPTCPHVTLPSAPSLPWLMLFQLPGMLCGLPIQYLPVEILFMDQDPMHLAANNPARPPPSSLCPEWVCTLHTLDYRFVSATLCVSSLINWITGL